MWYAPTTLHSAPRHRVPRRRHARVTPTTPKHPVNCITPSTASASAPVTSIALTRQPSDRQPPNSTCRPTHHCRRAPNTHLATPSLQQPVRSFIASATKTATVGRVAKSNCSRDVPLPPNELTQQLQNDTFMSTTSRSTSLHLRFATPSLQHLANSLLLSVPSSTTTLTATPATPHRN